MKRVGILIGISVGLAMPTVVMGGDTKRALPGAGDNPRCEAQCRASHQRDAAALEACLRDCGAIEPAGSPTGPRPGVQPAGPAAASSLNSSKSNAKRASGGDEPPEDADGGA